MGWARAPVSDHCPREEPQGLEPSEEPGPSQGDVNVSPGKG